MDSLIQRGQVLLANGRPDLAIDLYRQALAQDPENVLIHYGICHCLLDLKQPEEAMTHAHTVIGLEPQLPDGHQLLSQIQLHLQRPGPAARHAEQALEIDPEDPINHALLAQCHLQRKQWKQALVESEAGLALDPDHEDCLNIHSLALNQLGRFKDAEADIQRSLELDPDDPRTHANAGWNALRSGNHVNARQHFLEALRLEPEQEWARTGLIEAIKAKNIIYRQLFRVMAWLTSFPPGKFMLIMVLSVIFRGSLLELADSYPILEIPVNIVIWAIFTTFITVMISDPITNLILLTHPLGRHALNTKERIQAIIIAVAAIPMLGGAIGLFLPGQLNNTAFEVFFVGIISLVPLAFASSPRKLVPWSRIALSACTALIAGLGATAIYYINDNNVFFSTMNEQLHAVGIDGIDGLLAMDDNALVTPAQQHAITSVDQAFAAKSDQLTLGNHLFSGCLWTFVAFTWLAGALRRESSH